MSVPIERAGRAIRRALRRAAAAIALLAAVGAAPGCVISGAVIGEAELRFPDRGEHVDVPNGEADGDADVAATLRLRYVERGSGAPVVLIHGAFGGLEDYEATILDGVAEQGRAIAFDRAGHGWSERCCEPLTPDAHARVLRDACRALGVERPVLVGFSYGGAVAAAWASRWPDEVSGLVLLNAPTHPWGGAPDPVYVLARTPLVGDAFLWNVVPPLAALLADSGAENAFAPEPVAPDFGRSPVALAVRPSGFRANAEDLEGLDAALVAQCERYGAITCPVAFVVGAGDRIVGPEFHSPKFIVQVPQTERIVVPGAGHQLLFAHRDVCLDAVRRVLARR